MPKYGAHVYIVDSRILPRLGQACEQHMPPICCRRKDVSAQSGSPSTTLTSGVSRESLLGKHDEVQRSTQRRQREATVIES